MDNTMIDEFKHRAEDWDSPRKIEMSNAFVKELLKYITFYSDWKVMEIGAGTGLVGLQIAPFVREVIFEDTSAAMLEMLLKKIDNTFSFQLVCGEIYEYKNSDIDLVLSCMAFHHIPDIEKALTHLFEITSEHALIVIGDIRTEDGSFHHYKPIPHKGFDIEVLTNQFKNAGFELVITKTYDVLTRERTPGVITNYEQFILIAKKLIF